MRLALARQADRGTQQLLHAQALHTRGELKARALLVVEREHNRARALHVVELMYCTPSRQCELEGLVG